MPASAGPAARTATTTERDLVEELLQEQPEAFTHLYSSYQVRLLKHLCSRTLDRGLAEDITHDALLRAADRIDQFDPARPFWPWLKRIADNLLVDSVRRSVRIDVTDDVADTVFDKDGTEQADERALLKAALKHLPARQQTALTLSYVHGLSATQAAVRLGISRNAFDQLLHRARAALKARYVALEPEAATRLRSVLLPTLLEWARRCRGRISSIAGNAAAYVSGPGGVVDAVIPALLISTALVLPQSAAASPASEGTVHAHHPRPSETAGRTAVADESRPPNRQFEAAPVQARERITEQPAAPLSTRPTTPRERARQQTGSTSTGPPAGGPVQAEGSHGVTRDESKIHARGNVDGSAGEHDAGAEQWVEFPCDGPTRRMVCDATDLPEQLPPPPDPGTPPAEGTTP